MRKSFLWVIVISIILCSGIILIASIIHPENDVIGIGTFIVLSFTLISLVFYAYDTNLLASIAQSKWERESVLNSTYEMLGPTDKGGAGRVIFRITNPSTQIIKAKVWAEFKVYGVSVNPGEAFAGTNFWLVFPQQTSQGWYEISDLLAQQGKNPQQMITEYTNGNKTTQLTLDLTIEFRDEMGNRRKLPTRRHHFDFAHWNWIPDLIETDGWDT